MKKLLLTFFIFTSVFTYSQTPGEWTWMKGDSMLNQSGNFGTQGVPDPMNNPHALYESCAWTDASGKFWLFGGTNSGFSAYCDMWCFDPATNEWTWINGPGLTSIPGVYGIQGTPSAANHPGSRSWGSSFWNDQNGNLWLFGGQGRDSAGIMGHLNDLWRYNISTNEWTWMKGSPVWGDSGSYGIAGVPSPSNSPPARSETRCSWVDASGNFYLTGGYFYDSFTRNDLWKYNPVTNEWVWLRGSNVPTTVGSYGTMGVSSPLNDPPPHWIYTDWNDAGNLWMFGGRKGFAGAFNDLWKYNPANNEWTWMSGTTAIYDPGNYGPLCDTSSAFIPEGRFENSYCWQDACSNFYIYSGYGFSGPPCDLWQYNVPTNTWKLIRGSSSFTAINWGTLGVSNPANNPGGRSGGSSWVDAQGNFWLYGGIDNTSSNFFNDLWRYVPDSTCTKCNASTITANYFSSNTILCPGTCASFTNNSVNATSYQWFFPGAIPDTSTATNPTNICYASSGSYNVQLIATNTNGSDTLLLSNYITVYPAPAPQAIAQSGDTLFANAGAATYQWFFNSALISGATNYFYVAPSSGDYNVVCTDSNGCEVEAAVFNVIAASPTQPPQRGGVEIHPNPVADKLVVSSSELEEREVDISIYSILGEKVLAVSPLSQRRGVGGEADVSALPSGMYYLEVTDVRQRTDSTGRGNKVFRSKFVKQ